MTGHEQVVTTLGRIRITHQAATGANGGEILVAARDHFVGVDLVARVPDEAVLAEIEDRVQGQGKLHHPQIGSEIRRSLAEKPTKRFPHLAGQLFQLRMRDFLEILRRTDRGQQRVHQRFLSKTYRASVSNPPARIPKGRSASHASPTSCSALRTLASTPSSPGERELPQAGVLTQTLSYSRLFAADVQDVINDLKCQPHTLAVSLQCRHRSGVGPRGQSAQSHRDPDHRAGLVHERTR